MYNHYESEEIKELQLELDNCKIVEAKCKESYEKVRDYVCDRFVNTLNKILGDSICDEFRIVRPHVQSGFGNFEFCCEMGFVTSEKEDRLEFGSSFYFYYRDGKIEVNCGTIGYYGLDNKYQLMRNKALYYITCVHGKIIEELFSNIDLSCLSDSFDKYCSTMGNVKRVEHKINQKERELVEKELLVGASLSYDVEKVNNYNKLPIGSNYYFKKEKFVISKVTPNFVTMDIYDIDSGKLLYKSEKVRKFKLVDAICSNVVVVVK